MSKTKMRGSSFDAPVAGAAGKRQIVRPQRLDSDDEAPAPRRRNPSKGAGANSRVPSHEREDGRKIAQQWTHHEATVFYTSFHKQGQDWRLIAKAVGSKSADACEELYKQHCPYLSLDEGLQSSHVFVAMAVGKGASGNEETALVGLRSPSVKKPATGQQAARKGRRTPRPGNAVPKGSEPRTPAGVSTLPYTIDHRLDLLLGVPEVLGAADQVSDTAPAGTLAEPAVVAARPQVPWGLRKERKPSKKLVSARMDQEDEAPSAVEAPSAFMRDETPVATPVAPDWDVQEDEAAFLLDFAAIAAEEPKDEAEPSPAAPSPEPPAEQETAGERSAEPEPVVVPAVVKSIRASNRGKPELPDQEKVDEVDGKDLAEVEAAVDNGDIAIEDLPTPGGRITRGRAAKRHSTPPPPTPPVKRQQKRLREVDPVEVPSPQPPLKKRLRTATLSQHPSTGVKAGGPAIQLPGPSSSANLGGRGMEDMEIDAAEGQTPSKGNGPDMDDQEMSEDAFESPSTSSERDTSWAPRRSRRKPLPERAPNFNTHNLKAMFANRRQQVPGPDVTFAGDGEVDHSMSQQEAKLRHMLAPRPRRWITCEFFYSAIDRPWFMENPMADWLRHVGISPRTKAYAKEWGLIRSFGQVKRRRLSLNFLREERASLEKHREVIRKEYEEKGIGGEVPNDMPRQLGVGQRVTARHPHTRQLHDGKILTVNAAHHYRVQFDRRELGAEVVKDIDVMPIDPTENLPASMLADRPATLVNGRMAGGSQPPAVPSPLGPDIRLGRAQAVTYTAQDARASVAAAIGAHQKLPDSNRQRHIQHLSMRLLEIQSKLAELDSEKDRGIHFESPGRLSDHFQRKYSELILQQKQVMEQIQRLESLATPDTHYVAREAIREYLQSAQKRPASAPHVTAPSSTGFAWEDVEKEAQRCLKVANHADRMHRRPDGDVRQQISVQDMTPAVQAVISREANAWHHFMVGVASMHVSLCKVSSLHPAQARVNFMKSLDKMEPKCKKNQEAYAKLKSAAYQVLEHLGVSTS